MKIFIIIVVFCAAAYGIFYYKNNQEGSEPVTVLDHQPTVVAESDKAPVSTKSTSLNELMESGQFEEAVKKLEKTSENNRNSDWKIKKVEAEIGLGNREKAITLLDEAISEVPDDKKAELKILKSDILNRSGAKSDANEQLFEVITEHPGSQQAQDAAMKLKDNWKMMLNSRNSDFDYTKYNRALSYLLENSIDTSIQEECYQLLEKVNARIFHSPNELEGVVAFHKVKYGETLEGIAKKYKVYRNRIVRVNSLKDNGNHIRENQRLRIILGRVKVVVMRESFDMNVYLGDLFFKHYRVGIGKEGKTPTLITKISGSRDINPQYTNPEDGKVYPAGHPDNPIGSRWMGFIDGNGLGIHGTQDPSSIGKDSSNGCIRLKNEDVEELYDFIIEGDEVCIY